MVKEMMFLVKYVTISEDAQIYSSVGIVINLNSNSNAGGEE